MQWRWSGEYFTYCIIDVNANKDVVMNMIFRKMKGKQISLKVTASNVNLCDETACVEM